MKKTIGIAGWAVLGGVLGAAVALLTAPAPGKETRARLGRRAARLVPGRRPAA